MAISHSGQPTFRKPLRLWPGVVSGVVLALGLSVLAGLFPEAMLWAMAGTIAAVVAIAIWWLFFCRAPWMERVGAILFAVVAFVATQRVAHQSIAGDFLLVVCGIPLLAMALVVGSVVGARLSTLGRRAGIVGAILVACGGLLLARTDGINILPAELHWRWTPTPEDLGLEFSASAKDSTGAVEVTGRLLPPSGAGPLRGVIAVVQHAVGGQVYRDPAWRQLAEDLRCGLLLFSVRNTAPGERTVQEDALRNAAIGGAEALELVLTEIGRRSSRPELRDAKLVLWGHSAAGSFATTFAGSRSPRTIGFVRYHSHSRDLPLALATIATIPALILAGEHDTIAGVEDSASLWESARALEAPWTFAIEPGAAHASWSLDQMRKANQLAIPWVRAIFTRRVPDDGSSLRPIDQTSGWLASHASLEVAPVTSFRGPKTKTSWLPDEASATGWRILLGVQK